MNSGGVINVEDLALRTRPARKSGNSCPPLACPEGVDEEYAAYTKALERHHHNVTKAAAAIDPEGSLYGDAGVEGVACRGAAARMVCRAGHSAFSRHRRARGLWWSVGRRAVLALVGRSHAVCKHADIPRSAWLHCRIMPEFVFANWKWLKL